MRVLHHLYPHNQNQTSTSFNLTWLYLSHKFTNALRCYEEPIDVWDKKSTYMLGVQNSTPRDEIEPEVFRLQMIIT